MSDVGVLLQQWRRSRRIGQLALAAEAAVSLRHLCLSRPAAHPPKSCASSRSTPPTRQPVPPRTPCAA